MGAKEIADKYIGRRGGRPKPPCQPNKSNRRGVGEVTLSVDEYRRLLLAAETDDRIVRCFKCGAWLDRDEPAAATCGEEVGCWKALTGAGPCVAHRAPPTEK